MKFLTTLIYAPIQVVQYRKVKKIRYHFATIQYLKNRLHKLQKWEVLVNIYEIIDTVILPVMSSLKRNTIFFTSLRIMLKAFYFLKNNT